MQQDEYAYKLGIEGEYIYDGWNDYKYKTKRTLRPVAGPKQKTQLEKEQERQAEYESQVALPFKRMADEYFKEMEKLFAAEDRLEIKYAGEDYWTLHNLGATNAEDEGSYYTSPPILKDGYVFPTEEGLKKFITGANKGKRISPNGYIITIYSKGGVTLVEGTYLVFGGYKYNTEGRTPSEECMVRMVYNY